MDILNQLLQGFISAGTPVNLLWCLLGCTIGTAVGVLPGIGPATAAAMQLPITLKVDPAASMIFFSGIYYGAMYGGSTTSILLNTLGESGSMVTAMEGNKMAKSGRAGAALATSAIGSFVAGTIATACHLRCVAGRHLHDPARAARVLPADGAGLKQEWSRSWPAWLSATFIGFPFGTIPAGGSEIPTFLSYAAEKKLSKHPEEFGTVGAIEGVAGPEAANNAAITATLIPLLMLGIPTSNTTAILLGAFQNYGIQPGPQLFEKNSALVWR